MFEGEALRGALGLFPILEGAQGDAENGRGLTLAQAARAAPCAEFGGDFGGFHNSAFSSRAVSSRANQAMALRMVSALSPRPA